MSIPQLNNLGLIPEGRHQATLDEVKNFYCGNPNRLSIWEGFLSFCQKELMPKGLHLLPVLLDGGFTSKKANTKDIDIVLDCSTLDKTKLFDLLTWHATEHDRIEAEFKVDFWLYHPLLPSDLTAFFSYVNPKDRVQLGADNSTRKGFIVINYE
jgi:hypothetical protein